MIFKYMSHNCYTFMHLLFHIILLATKSVKETNSHNTTPIEFNAHIPYFFLV